MPVAAGSSYTFNLTPDAATLPDPYGVCIGSTDPYPGGTMGLDDPGGSQPTGFDVVFRTRLASDRTSGPTVFRAASPVALADASHAIASDATAPFDDDAPPAAPVLYYAVDDGRGEPAVIRLVRLPPAGVRIAWP